MCTKFHFCILGKGLLMLPSPIIIKCRHIHTKTFSLSIVHFWNYSKIKEPCNHSHLVIGFYVMLTYNKYFCIQTQFCFNEVKSTEDTKQFNKRETNLALKKHLYQPTYKFLKKGQRLNCKQ